MYLIELQQISIKNLRKSAEPAFYGGFSAENWPKYREIPLFSQNREYLKTISQTKSRARMVRLSWNLDQLLFAEVSKKVQELFENFDFSAWFAGFWVENGHFCPPKNLRIRPKNQNFQKASVIF